MLKKLHGRQVHDVGADSDILIPEIGDRQIVGLIQTHFFPRPGAAFFSHSLFDTAKNNSVKILIICICLIYNMKFT